jgi:Flp pilus assembly protein TadG
VTPSFPQTSLRYCGTGTYPSETGGNENQGDQATVTAAQPFTLAVFGLPSSTEPECLSIGCDPMKRAAAILGRVRRRDGQVLPLVALFMVVLIGFAALVFDIGRVYVAQQQLQAAVNSAALVAGQDLPNATTAYNAAVSYSGAPGEKNAVGGYGVTAGSPTVTFECVSHAPDYTAGSPPTCPTDRVTRVSAHRRAGAATVQRTAMRSTSRRRRRCKRPSAVC